MIKLIIFDLDGVLVDAKEIHYESLNNAIAEFFPHMQITREDHLDRYDGLSTAKKLEMLTEENGLPKEYYKMVWDQKQRETWKIIKEMDKDQRMIEVLRLLKEKNFEIAVASNSIRETLKLMLHKTGLLEYVDFYLSNEDVIKPKPSPEIYMRAMIMARASPTETLIVEDSKYGRKAALASGAHLMGVISPEDVTFRSIMAHVDMIEEKPKHAKWQDKAMNVVIPMAGRGSRFEQAGYTFPKPLIEVRGKPMIQVVVENLNVDANFIYVVQKEHYEKYNLKTLLNLITPGCKIVVADNITWGAACTVLLTKQYIDTAAPLLMANSDQFLEWNSFDFMYDSVDSRVDGSMATFKATHPKWSFVEVNERGYVTKVAEKNPISDTATCGIYYWKRGSDFVKYAEQMIKKNIMVNNEFYVCPVFNQAIADGKKIKTHNIGKMWGIGTPEDLNYFLTNYTGNI